VIDLDGKSLYEVLDVPRSATRLTLQRAYERARAIYGPESLASYALLDPDEAEAVTARLEEARRVLLDPVERARYDQRFPPDAPRAGEAPPAPAARARPAPRPRVPATDVRPAEGERWTGALLRQVREARGLSVEELSEQTKVMAHHLRSVEADRIDRLPPRVYLRGFVLSVADALGLDGKDVARSYLEHLASAGHR
jgi:hypothetical protein